MKLSSRILFCQMLCIVSTVFTGVAFAQATIYTNRLAVGNAIEADDAALLAQIHKKGGDLQQKNLFGLTPLMEAAASGSVACATYLVSQHVDLNEKSLDGFAAAYYAVYIDPADSSRMNADYLKRRAHVLKILIDAGADVKSVVWPVRGFTLVHIAALTGNMNSLSVLLAAGADVNARSTYHETPIMIAAQADHLDCVRLLVAHGADLTAETIAGTNVLDFAQGFPDVIDYLKKAGVLPGTLARQMNSTP